MLYERTAPVGSRELHRKAGAALERERAAGAAVTAAELAMHFERGRDPMPALRYYAEAAEAALLHFSPARVHEPHRAWPDLLDQPPRRRSAPRSRSRSPRFAACPLSTARRRLRDEERLQRAYSLLRRVPQHPMRGLLLHGLGFLLSLRAEYAEALAVADRTQALSSTTNDAVLPGRARARSKARSHAARAAAGGSRWLERGLARA